MKIFFGIHEKRLHVFSIMSGFPGVSSTKVYLVSCPCSMFHDNLSEGVTFLDREYFTFRLFFISSWWLIRLLRCDWALLCKIKRLVIPAKDAGKVNMGSFCHHCRQVVLSRIPCLISLSQQGFHKFISSCFFWWYVLEKRTVWHCRGKRRRQTNNLMSLILPHDLLAEDTFMK